MVVINHWLQPNFGCNQLSLFSCRMLSLSQKQVQNLRMLMFVNSMIIGFRSPNFSQRCMLVYWDRINWHFGVWEKKYYKIEFQPFGTESSQFLAERNDLAASLAVIAKWQAGTQYRLKIQLCHLTKFVFRGEHQGWKAKMSYKQIHWHWTVIWTSSQKVT